MILKNLKKEEKKMEKDTELLSSDKTNEESILKSMKKYNNLNESINSNNDTKMNIISDKETDFNNSNVFIENIKILNTQRDLNQGFIQNETKITRKKQFIIYIPIVTLKIIIPCIFMLTYIIYSFENIEDQNYCKYSVIILTVFILFCYYLAVFSKSSQSNVNKYFNDNIYTHKNNEPGSEIQNIDPFQWNDCPFCKWKKFIRSSHCRVCNKCVLMRDHHCPYLANCVGFNNIQYFFNFVFWGDTGLIFYFVSFIKSRFFSENIIDINIYIKIFMYFDLFFSGFFVLNITSILIRLLVTVYNNKGQKETMVGPATENYCPVCYCFTNYPKYMVEREVNIYNIGFLSHFYYLIGPTIFHLIFPLPKYNNYLLDENCPVFKKIYSPDRLDLYKYKIKMDPSQLNILNEGESTPEAYLKSCHEFFDGKIIV